MQNKIKKIEVEKESYETIDEAVEAVFMNKKDRKRMFSALFLLAIVGAIVITTGTYFLKKQQEVIIENKNIDWKNQYKNGFQMNEGGDDSQQVKQTSQSPASEVKVIQNNQQSASLEILFLGDLMLDRYNRELMDRKNEEWMTKQIESLFVGNDITVANLEGPVTENDSISIGSEEGSKNNYVFTFDPENTSEFLKQNNINLLNLGNNHILNFGKEGLWQTKDFISKNNFEYFADIQGESDEYIGKNINGIKVGFVSYNQFGGSGFDETKRTVEDSEKTDDLTIVYTHWGAEYELIENDNQKQKAHEFIDVGADLIVGSHPHVVQPVEVYKGKTIFYSLGNFIFDQYFSDDTMTGLAVKASIYEDNELGFALVPLELQRSGQIQFADEESEKNLLNRILKTKEVKAQMNF